MKVVPRRGAPVPLRLDDLRPVRPHGGEPMDAVEHLASRFAALVLANRQAEALIGMYQASGDRGYLEQACAVLQDSTVPVRLASHPRTPREQQAADAIELAPNAWDDLLDEPCFATDDPTPADVLARFPMPRRT